MSETPPRNFVGSISHFFVSNQPLSILVLTLAVIFGALSFLLLPKQYNPEIIRPAFSLSLEYQGATVDAALNRVVYELNKKVQTVPGVEDVLFTVTDGAVIEATIIFMVGYDATKAKVDLLSQLDQHSYLARGFIGTPQLLEINPETIPVLHVVFSSDTQSVRDVRSHVTELSYSLSAVAGVSDISVAGGYEPAIVVELDPVRLSNAGLTSEDISSVLTASQARLVTTGTRVGGYVLQMEYDGLASTVEEIGLLPIGSGLVLRDVAVVFEGVSGSRSYVLDDVGNGPKEAVTLSVAKIEGTSAPVVTEAVLDRLAENMSASKYADMSYAVVSDDGTTAIAEIQGLMTSLMTSIVIVAGILLLFLSFRAAAVVLVAIPTTLLIVFGLGLLFDQTINRITLFALIMSLGLLVDSAIVVVENIYSRLKEQPKEVDNSQRTSVVAGAVHEVGVGLVLSTVTSVIVFLPMNYITGMMGPYMGPIAFFVPVALVVTLMVSTVIVPFVAARLLDPHQQPSKLNTFTGSLMQRATSRYTAFLQSILSSRVRQKYLLRGALALFVISLMLPAFGLVHFQMLPKADRDQFYTYIDTPVGTDVSVTANAATKVGEYMLSHPAVVSVQYFIAEPPLLDFNGLFKGAPARTASHQASLRVNLTPAADRSDTSTAIVTDLRQGLQTEYRELSDYVRLLEEPPGPPVQATFVAKLLHDDAQVRTEVSHAMREYLLTVAGVVDIYETREVPTSRIRYEYDHVAGGSLGVTSDSAASTLRLLGEPQPATELLDSGAVEYTPIMLSVAASSRSNPSDISGLAVPSQTGEIIPLTSVITTHTEARPVKVELEGARQLTYVTAEVEGRSIVYVVIEVIYGLITGNLAGYQVTDWGLFGLTLVTADGGETVVLEWGGEWEMTLDNFRDLGMAMGAALLLVYAVLVAQYRRFDAPAYILITVPLGLVGILWGFFVIDTFFGVYLTATALIGFIALIGVVVNNAIIYLEFVTQSEQAGLSRVDALIAAGQARLRPIILTSLTTVLGSLTIVSDPVWSGLAWAIVFGLSLSTLMTLVVYPTMLVYFNKNNKQ